MRGKRFLKISAIAVLAVMLIVVVYDLVLWRRTLIHIDRISALKGSSYREALKFLKDNRESLDIAAVREYENGDKKWLVVELRHVSFIGVLVSAICPFQSLAELEISGLLEIDIEEGRVSSCSIFF